MLNVIFALSGRRNSGKDVVGRLILERLDGLRRARPWVEIAAARFAFASPLCQAATTLTGLSSSFFTEQGRKEQPMPGEHGGLLTATPRDLLLQLGDLARAIDGRMLVGRMQDQLRQFEQWHRQRIGESDPYHPIALVAVVTDVRLDNELQGLREMTRHLVHLEIERDDRPVILDEQVAERFDGHPTEAGVRSRGEVLRNSGQSPFALSQMRQEIDRLLETHVEEIVGVL